MHVIPVDVSQLKVLVVGEPKPQMKDGQAIVDRVTNHPMWNLDVTVIGEDRAETVQLALPEGGFPKNLSLGTVVIPEGMIAVAWSKNGRSGVMVRAKSVRVEGGSTATKGAAA